MSHYLANHIQKLQNHATLMSSGISSLQASRIVFNSEAVIVPENDIEIHQGIINDSLTKCIQMHLRSCSDPQLDVLMMGLERTTLAGTYNDVFMNEEGQWEFELGTFGNIPLKEIEFDDRVIILATLEEVLG